MNLRYDFEKETDRDFLRAAGMMLQERVIRLEIENMQLQLQKAQDEEVKGKLTGELLVLRRKFFDSKQEKKDKIKDLKKKKKKKSNLLHNQNANKEDIAEWSSQELKLDSEDVVHDLSSFSCPNCSIDLSEIKNLFEESTEFDVNATYYILKRHKRKKYKCPHCQQLITAPGPSKLVPGGQFSIQMAVKIACDKFEYHLPLERQRLKMEKCGLIVSVKTLFSLTEHLYKLLYSLNEMIRQDVLSGDYVCLDESPLVFYNPNKSSGYAWSISNNIAAYYQFEPTRSQDVAREMIKGFKGILVTDGYERQTFLAENTEIIHVYCWAHVRRYFFDAMAEDERAGDIVDYIDDLYDIEHKASSYSELKHLRETESTEVYNEIEAWIEKNEACYLSSTLTGKAITYFYNQRAGLKHFLKNEKIPLDNNAAERRQRCPVMGRKNYLLFRTINGADVGMFFYSLIESCKTNGLGTEAYLQEMALRSLEGKKLETPYQYASRLKREISERLKAEILERASSNTS